MDYDTLYLFIMENAPLILEVLEEKIAEINERFGGDMSEEKIEEYLNRSDWSIFWEEKRAYLRKKIKRHPFLQKTLYDTRDIYGSLKKFVRDIRSGHFFRKFFLPFSQVAEKIFRRCK